MVASDRLEEWSFADIRILAMRRGFSRRESGREDWTCKKKRRTENLARAAERVVKKAGLYHGYHSGCCEELLGLSLDVRHV